MHSFLAMIKYLNSNNSWVNFHRRQDHVDDINSRISNIVNGIVVEVTEGLLYVSRPLKVDPERSQDLLRNIEERG